MNPEIKQQIDGWKEEGYIRARSLELAPFGFDDTTSVEEFICLETYLYVKPMGKEVSWRIAKRKAGNNIFYGGEYEGEYAVTLVTPEIKLSKSKSRRQVRINLFSE